MSKLRITPIGTCRIHTPLRRAPGRYPVEIDHRRNYGFVHTSDEALQLVRFLQGDKSFQPQVAPLVARDGDLAQYESEAWDPSPLHIVEISSAKRITSGADSVQANYLAHHFADFFANSERSRAFWSLVKKSHRKDLMEFLRRQESYQLLSGADRELLASLQMEPQSFKSIKTDMAEIVERLGRERVLFVTHVNAAAADGELIPVRDRLVRWVRMAAEQLEAAVFDPTVAMQDFGQEKAMESGGADLTHYTPAFSDRVYDEIHRAHVVPLLGGTDGLSVADPVEEQTARQAAKLEAMLEIGDFFAAAREIHRSVEQSPDALALVELRGLVRSRVGDFRGAVSDLTRRGDDGALSHAMRVGLVEALNATGDPAGALRIADNLIAEEYASASLFHSAAEAAEKCGRIDQAIGYAKQAFRNDRRDLSAALHALVLIGEHRPDADRSAWRREVLQNAGSSATGAFEVALWAVRNRDDAVFAAALKAVAPLDKAGAVDLLEDASNAGMHVGVASSVELAASLGRLPRSISARRLEIIEGLLDEARRLNEEGRIDLAFTIARGILPLEDISSSQIPGVKLAREASRLIRLMSQQVRTSVREAYKAKTLGEVIAAGEAAGDLLLELPDVAAVYARALHSAGRTEDALALMRRTRARNPDSFIAARWTARLAAIAGDYSTALEIYGEIRRSKESVEPEIESELDRFFGGVEGRALKQLRGLIISGDHDPALRLARLIRSEVGAEERVEKELGRLHSLLRRRLKDVELGDGESEEAEAVLRQIVEVRPADVRMLRKLALRLMRQHRFGEAAEIWDRISSVDPTDDASPRQRERCLKMAERRAAAWQAELA